MAWYLGRQTHYLYIYRGVHSTQHSEIIVADVVAVVVAFARTGDGHSRWPFFFTLFLSHFRPAAVASGSRARKARRPRTRTGCMSRRTRTCLNQKTRSTENTIARVQKARRSAMWCGSFFRVFPFLFGSPPRARGTSQCHQGVREQPEINNVQQSPSRGKGSRNVYSMSAALRSARVISGSSPM